MGSRRRHVQGSGRTQASQRSSRLNELLREIIAEELNRIDDERLDWVSITHVRTDRSLDRAVVMFTAALGDIDEEFALVEVFEEHRKRLQSAIGRQTSLRRTPPLLFEPDLQLRNASRIENLIAEEKQRPGNSEDSGEDPSEDSGEDPNEDSGEDPGEDSGEDPGEEQ